MSLHQSIIDIDNTFNFKKAYKINDCTLVNFIICEVHLQQTFYVDSVISSIEYPSVLYVVKYREWQNKAFVVFIGTDKDVPPAKQRVRYFSSRRKARYWRNKQLSILGYIKQTQDEAHQTVLSKIETLS